MSHFRPNRPENHILKVGMHPYGHSGGVCSSLVESIVNTGKGTASVYIRAAV